MRHFIISAVLVFVLLLAFASTKTYYVLPTASTPCPEKGVPCFTLTQYATKPNNYFASDTTLILLPGYHTLDSEFELENNIIFAITENAISIGHSDASITCHHYARFTLKNIGIVIMRGLVLIGCMNNKITFVEQFTLSGCSLRGQGRNGTGLELNWVNSTNIEGNSFYSFTGEEILDSDHNQANSIRAGGSIIIRSSTVRITSSTFTNNIVEEGGSGGVVYAHGSSEITINNTTFTNNTVNGHLGWGGAIYAGGSSKITINNSIFTKNTVNGNDACGGAMSAEESSEISINNTSFTNNTVNGKRGSGGAVCAKGSSDITVDNASFNNNNVNGDYGEGGAVSVEDLSNFNNKNVTFNNNTLRGTYGHGGAVCAKKTIVIANNTIFTYNYVTGYKGSGGVVYAESSNVTIHKTIFNNNTVNGDNGHGGAVYAQESNITAHNTIFNNNNATGEDGAGGAVYALWQSEINLNNTTFTNNSVTGDHGKGGAMYADSSGIVVNNVTFNNNTVKGYNGEGGAMYTWSIPTIEINNTLFASNTASQYGGAIMAVSSNVTMNELVDLQNNTADVGGVIYATQSTMYLTGNTTILNNHGSFYVYASNVTFMGHISTNMNSNSTSTSQEGGALTLIQSEIFFAGTANFSHNTAIHGGAISATQSRLCVYGNTTIAHNTAYSSGGGIYAYQSELNFEDHINISNNNAADRGGGIHIISSITKMTDRSRTYFIKNLAKRGGAACLEMNAKLFILKNQIEYLSYDHKQNDNKWIKLEFFKNSADYGGALYVNDDTNSGLCHVTPFSAESECFIQGLSFATLKNDHNFLNTYFTNNSANEDGDAIYGGLLDRCTVNPNAEYFPKSSSAVSYILKITNLNIQDFNVTTKAISSDPVRVCFCRDNNSEPDCSYYPKAVKVKKGEMFTMSLVAVDQVNNTVSNSTILSYLSTEAGLGEGQAIQNTGEGCTGLLYTVTSPRTSERLHLYANGTCKDIGISLRTVEITFTSCPIGFKELNSKCDCDPKLAQYISNCSIDIKSVLRKGNTWIAFINISGNKSIVTYPNCPFDYCFPSTRKIQINVEIPEDEDKQCAFNRSGKLCGSCKDGLSLSLGTSRCMLCTNNWLTLLLLFAIAGIALVAFLLVCNLTVAAGTVNGLLFYANIVSSNQATFSLNSISLFIAWLNLDFGFETCFFNGLNGYWKTWLQLAFPAYVIFLVILVIKVCECSNRFARLIARKNPVATLDTLVLLSYTKFIRIIISAWQFATLEYSDGKYEIVWLVDGNINYFELKHIPLFVVALLILALSTVYTTLLLCWQWLLLCPNKQPVRWIRNSRLHGIMDAYFITFNKNHRYWTGLLLLARVILYLVSALNGVVTTDPRVNFESIICVCVSLLLWKAVIKGRIYRKWLLDILDTSFLFNLTLLTVTTWYVREVGGNQTAVVNTSVSIALFTFILITSYHVYAFVLPATQVEMMKAKFLKCLKDNESQPQQVQNIESGITNYDNDMAVSETVVDKPEIPVTVDEFQIEADDSSNDYGYSSMTTGEEDIELKDFVRDNRSGTAAGTSGSLNIPNGPQKVKGEASDESDYDELAPLLLSYDTA